MNRWPRKPLGELAGKGQYGLNATAMSEGTGVRFVRITDITRAGELRHQEPAFVPQNTPELDLYELKDGDVLIARSGATAGKSYVHRSFGQRAVFAGYLIRFQPDTSLVLPDFIGAFLQTPDYWRQLNSHKRAVAQPNVNAKQLASIDLPVPPLAEQERIVMLLDEADELRKLRTQADRCTADLIPALFHEMFGDVDSNSKNWPVVRFAEIGEARLGKMLDAKQQTGKHKRAYLRNANVQWDRLELNDLLEMDFSEADREEFRLRYGDLLICEGGEVGRAAVWRDELPECYFQKALHRVRLYPSKAKSEFVLHLLQALAKVNGFQDYIGTATIPHLTGIKLASIRIPLPPLTLQKEFASKVTEIREMEAKQAASRECLDALFQSMLHRAFRGEL